MRLATGQDGSEYTPVLAERVDSEANIWLASYAVDSDVDTSTSYSVNLFQCCCMVGVADYMFGAIALDQVEGSS